jgi:hypothetical protein
MGIASFVLAVMTGAATFGLFVFAGFMEASTPGGLDEESPVAIVVGLSLFAVMGLHLLGIGLGIGGAFQGDRKKVFAILGISINILVILGVIGLVLLGLALEA